MSASVDRHAASGSGQRAFCHHCGLPCGGAGGEGPAFCCSGCYLAWRIVGDQEEAGIPAAILVRLGIAGALALNVMMVSLVLYSEAIADIGGQAIHVFRWALLALSAPVLLILVPPYLVGAARELRQGRPNMDSLIAIGALAGFGVSAVHVAQGRGHIYFDTATMLLVLVTIGKLLEASAKTRAARDLKDLLQLAPPQARLLTEGGEREVPAASLQRGDRVRVRPGERVAADGVVAAGRSAVQEAALTGEPLPRPVAPGDGVYGGSVNGEGEITVEVTAGGEEALVAQIGRLVERAQRERAPAERAAARMAAAFIPTVLAISAGAFAYWLWRGEVARGGMSALAVLVVACPCALGLATPVAVSVALARAARQAVLIRSGEALEALAQVTAVFFDKTGTLTQGRPQLQQIVCGDGSCTEQEALSWLASLESSSEHVVGRAVVQAAAARGLPLGQTEAFLAFPGQGAWGRVRRGGESRELWAGTAALLSAQGINVNDTDLLPDTNATASILFVAWEGRVRAAAALADAPRSDAAAAIAELEQLGVEVAMLSGDRRPAVEHIARAVGLGRAEAGLTPDAKLERVRAARRRGAVVAVVGDGINDAPALAEADVGIAMGSGTDLAREVGDVVLLGEGLARLPWLLRLARAMRRTIRGNLRWAFGYNLVALTLAFSGLLHPLLAALIMLGSSLFVLRNSLRLGEEANPPDGWRAGRRGGAELEGTVSPQMHTDELG
jgi:heavy metal translocating P-type ATPase